MSTSYQSHVKLVEAEIEHLKVTLPKLAEEVDAAKAQVRQAEVDLNGAERAFTVASDRLTVARERLGQSLRALDNARSHAQRVGYR